MVRPEVDWKRQTGHTPDWLTLAVGGALAVLYLYHWSETRRALSILLAAVLLGWGGIYVSAYWQPVFYLPMAGIFSVVTGYWLWEGAGALPFTAMAIGLNVAFVALSIYLFISEERWTV